MEAEEAVADEEQKHPQLCRDFLCAIFSGKCFPGTHSANICSVPPADWGGPSGGCINIQRNLPDCNFYERILFCENKLERKQKKFKIVNKHAFRIKNGFSLFLEFNFEFSLYHLSWRGDTLLAQQ